MNKAIKSNRSTISTASQKPSHGSIFEQPATLTKYADLASLEMDFSIRRSDESIDSTTVAGGYICELLNHQPLFLPLTDLLSAQFRQQLQRDHTKFNHHTYGQIVTGDNFDIDAITNAGQVPPNCTDYAVIVLRPNAKDVSGETKLFQCKYGGGCHKITANLSKFMDHMRSHTKERPFECHFDGCTKSFSQKTNVKQHIKEVHENVKPFKCTYCDKAFSKKFNCKSHMEVSCAKRKLALRRK